MKLPDFSMDKALNELRHAMGAELVIFVAAENTDTLTVEEIERLSREGIDIPLAEVRILPDGTLAYKNQRVVVYIRDVKQYRNVNPNEDDLPRFHISHCDKLQEMRANNRYQRYVVATRDSGLFQINLKRNNDAVHLTKDERLKVCQYCLSKLNWENFVIRRRETKERKEIVLSFTLLAYYSKFGKTFVDDLPHHTEATAPLNEYTKDFKTVGDKIKLQRGYRCDKCRINLSLHRKFLHAHHRNGVQSDNSETNIAILCIVDHAEQPYHQHMKKIPEYSEFIVMRSKGVFQV